MPALATRKVAVDFPEPLLEETETVAAEMSTNRSSFIRLAVENFLAERRRKKLEHELAEGYIANGVLARQIAEELAFTDSDIV